MAAIGTAAAQQIIAAGAAKGYSEHEIRAIGHEADGRRLEDVSGRIGRGIAYDVEQLPSRNATSTVPMATVPQVDYLADLHARFATPATAELRAQWARLTRRQASQLIDEYKATAGR